MGIQESWERALQKTEIIRARVKPLHVSEATHLPYVFLAESSLNMGDTITRKGEVFIQKPSIILPDHLPQFDGFEFDKDLKGGQDFLNTFFLVRGIRFPSLKYDNKTESLDIFEGKLSKAIEHYKQELQQKEDVHTGLMIGPEDCWQFSVIIFICHQILRQADGDIRKLLEDYRKGFEQHG